MKTETTGAPAPAEVLIPEARQHQRTRYRRRGAAVVIVALVVAALIVSAVLLVRGPAAGGRTEPAPKPVAATRASGVVYFRPVLCFAAPYAAPAGATHTAVPTGTEPIPPCSAASLLSPTNLDVLPDSGDPIGYSSNNTSADEQYAAYPSTSVQKPGFTSSTVLLPGVSGACDGSAQLRCVLGPVEMSSRAIAKATAARNQTGQWVVNYTTTAAGAPLWDRVARQSFHGYLGIELGGVVYSAPIIQPGQSSFSSFDGRGEISGSLTRAQAQHLAKALMSPTG
jgi:hypothetical protein